MRREVQASGKGAATPGLEGRVLQLGARVWFKRAEEAVGVQRLHTGLAPGLAESSRLAATLTRLCAPFRAERTVPKAPELRAHSGSCPLAPAIAEGPCGGCTRPRSPLPSL